MIHHSGLTQPMTHEKLFYVLQKIENDNTRAKQRNLFDFYADLDRIRKKGLMMIKENDDRLMEEWYQENFRKYYILL